MHETLCDYAFECVRNAFEAHATCVVLRVHEGSDRTEFSVSDDGEGMTARALASCCNPFVTAPSKHPERPTGLGLALLEQVLHDCGGTLCLRSEAGQGTTLTFAVPTFHPDAPPLGDLAECAVLCAAGCEANGRFVLELAPRASGPATAEPHRFVVTAATPRRELLQAVRTLWQTTPDSDASRKATDE